MTATRLAAAAVACLLVACAGASSPPATERAAARRLDDFESLAAWKAEGSDGVSARIAPTDGTRGRALQLEFDFQGHGGYAIARRALPLELPAHYELAFDLRGDAPANNLEVKLVDESGKNVWWYRKPDFELPRAWQPVRVKQRQIVFAWGPTTDKVLRRFASIEVVISAGKGGGRGTLAIDNLTLREVVPPPAVPPRPIASASSSQGGAAASLAVDGDPATGWRSGAGGEQSLTLDLGYPRELGGLTLRWLRGAASAKAYEVELSRDGRDWQVARRVTEGNGQADPLFLPESEARYVRLLLHGGARPYGLAEVEIEDLAAGASPNAFLAAVAAEARRGLYPRGFSGQQPYWTIVGVEGAAQSGLLSEDGALELAKGGASIEPFVLEGDEIVTWADVEVTQSLASGYLPIPSVTWRAPGDAWRLQVTAFADGPPDQARLAARYRLENRTPRALDLQLMLAVRPMQVNPPTQFLNTAGGVSPIRELGWDGRVLTVNRANTVHPTTPPTFLGLSSFDAGGFPGAGFPTGKPTPARKIDPEGLASAALVYDLHLAPGETAEIGLVSPLTGQLGQAREPPGNLGVREAAVASVWREKLNRTLLAVPPDGRALVDTLRSSLAHILMTREGPVLRPGSRSYDRSWIRDGAMISESLLRLGHAETAAAYLRWYAPFQFASGKVPCCVDARGADPVPENDSHGELIYLAAEVFRFTGDRALLEAMWPHVDKAARYLETLRQSERTAANRTPERRPRYGLLPPSISHEGYSAQPAYSYWDDFWGLIGYQDAAWVAGALGKRDDAARLARQRDEFRADLYASLAAAAALHRIDFIPGAADLGDFDATSTTIALAPGREGPTLPRAQLLRTFERYWTESVARADGTRKWDAYTPYELRTVGTFVRLGWRERANRMLGFFFADRRPLAWNQWAEVVGRDAREPRFIGDMPHAWVSSDYIRSALDMFVYARDEDTLVLAAGVPATWFDAGFEAERLRTAHGELGYAVARTSRGAQITVRGRATPPGGFAVPWPWDGAPGKARINGRTAAWKDGELRFSTLPARIDIERPAP